MLNWWHNKGFGCDLVGFTRVRGQNLGTWPKALGVTQWDYKVYGCDLGMRMCLECMTRGIDMAWGCGCDLGVGLRDVDMNWVYVKDMWM